jgi:hypothetical protein
LSQTGTKQRSIPLSRSCGRTQAVATSQQHLRGGWRTLRDHSKESLAQHTTHGRSICDRPSRKAASRRRGTQRLVEETQSLLPSIDGGMRACKARRRLMTAASTSSSVEQKTRLHDAQRYSVFTERGGCGQHSVLRREDFQRRPHLRVTCSPKRRQRTVSKGARKATGVSERSDR